MMKDGIQHKIKKVLVTGGTGFIGKYLVNALLSEGWAVLALVNKTPASTPSKNGLLQTVHADINDYDTISSLVSQVDYVCHLAAYIPDNHEDPSVAATCVQINALATLHLARMAVKNRLTRFVYTSSGNSYVHSECPVTEASPLYPVGRATYYLASKMLGEMYVEHLRHTAGLNSVCFRISTSYGWGMSTRSLIYRFMKSASEGLPLEVWDGGMTTYDFVCVSDIVGLILSALKSDPAGIFNAGSGRACSILELAQTVAEVFPEKELPIEVKPPVASIPASFSALSIEKARTTWGYNPTGLRDGLIRYRQDAESKKHVYRHIQ
jgi:UDP-glucose 4-epimerase